MHFSAAFFFFRLWPWLVFDLNCRHEQNGIRNTGQLQAKGFQAHSFFASSVIYGDRHVGSGLGVQQRSSCVSRSQVSRKSCPNASSHRHFLHFVVANCQLCRCLSCLLFTLPPRQSARCTSMAQLNMQANLPEASHGEVKMQPWPSACALALASALRFLLSSPGSMTLAPLTLGSVATCRKSRLKSKAHAVVS